MKKGTALLILFFLTLHIISAQEQIKHEQKVYINPDGKVFVNKNQPIYFRISTSPDADAQSYVLPSEKTAKYANPMYFDTEGRNTLRSPSAVDKITKKMILPKMDVLYDIYSDGLSPNTNLKLVNSAKYQGKKDLYFGTGLKSELIATDATSGVDKIYISVNNSNFAEYKTNSLTFDTEKSYTLKYYAVDNVGNAESAKTLTFHVDLSAPQTSYKILGESKGNVLSSKASISLVSIDTLSGVDKIWYSVNEGPYNIYLKPIPISVLKDQNAKISYFALDKVGNKEEPKVIATYTGPKGDENNSSAAYSFYIDKEAPQTKLEIEGNQYKTNLLYISEHSRCVLNASDDKSGVDKIIYSIDNLSLKSNYSEPVALPSAGLHSIAYAANDNVGNATLVKTQQIFVDATTPSSNAFFLGNQFQNRDTLFITPDTKLLIKANDLGSGIQNIKYIVDEGNEAIYNAPLQINQEGFHKIRYQAIDNVNNIEKFKSIHFLVDSSSPKILTNFSTKAIGEKTVRDEKYIIYPSNTMLYIAATDNASGGEHIEYRINGGKQWQNILPVKGFAPGNYEIEINAFDVLKNKSHITLKFAIEK